ncbi:thiamine pyrophosphate-binding protein [Gemmobacter aquaticus]|uniref:thiamine pyrophosphate-binding protein n=1 Tax=Gemmobacter aquaticus TaxID=490185 RepID=UPI0011B70024|nr:thiamine pyrophosphate-binding protein [Gemmobacter aquaticus]
MCLCSSPRPDPGVTNAVKVVANALQGRVPLVFLTGCVDPTEAEIYSLDQQADTEGASRFQPSPYRWPVTSPARTGSAGASMPSRWPATPPGPRNWSGSKSRAAFSASRSGRAIRLSPPENRAGYPARLAPETPAGLPG